MNKIAFFVEGQTEQVFIQTLLQEIFGQGKIDVISVKHDGGSTGGRSLMRIDASRKQPMADFFALIVDCGSDSKVTSEIRDGYSGLISAGYSAIIGMRDAFPDFGKHEIRRLLVGMAYAVRTTPIRPRFVVSVMELEAWFISEHTHFPRIHPKLTCVRISDALGFDPCSDDSEDLEHPSQDLSSIYGLVGLAYRKSRKHVERTVGALDYAEVYVGLPEKHVGFKVLVESIHEFMS